MKLQNIDWMKNVELKLVESEDTTKLNAYICSPCSAETADEIYQNMIAARKYMAYITDHLNCYGRAPHAYLPILLCDKRARDRALALNIGLELLEHCEVLYVCGNIITCGMRNEIAYAGKLHIPIIVSNEMLVTEVYKIYTKAGGSRGSVKTAPHAILGKPAQDLLKETMEDLSNAMQL